MVLLLRHDVPKRHAIIAQEMERVAGARRNALKPRDLPAGRLNRPRITRATKEPRRLVPIHGDPCQSGTSLAK